jgi:cytochrome c oxidase subunit III
MSGHAQVVSKESPWSGGQSPFRISYGKMMMWYFLVSDALTFGGLLTAYGFFRHASADPWPVGEQVFEALPFLHGAAYPLVYVALMTFILIVSSVTMVLAVEAGHRNDKKSVIKWMGWTVVGGLFFLSSQAWEWSHFIHGSGGGFQISRPLSVTTEDGTEMNLASGTWVHMTSEFGHELEHSMASHAAYSADEESHAGGHGHATDAHGQAADPNAHNAHSAEAHAAASHSTSPAGEAKHEIKVPEKLILNKYTLVHDAATGKDYRNLSVTGAEAKKLWEAKAPGTEVFGANLSKNEYAVQQQYANFFFFVTGFHGFHVFQGVIINLIIWIMAIKGVFERRGHYEMVEKVGLFWHFVDLVWVFVFTFFYLI